MGFFDDDKMLDETQSTIASIIGNNNYDIGHLFITGLGGVAWQGGVCDNRYKALGLSGLNRPEGPNFDMDIVAHEIGHQFGADHSFSGDLGTCFGNTTAFASVEPGSGSTIMSYAGLCEDQNVTTQVDAYFHSFNLEQISNFITSNGSSCASTISSNNDPPTANAGINYFIPKGTPFVLSGTSIDANSSTLSYTWEQMDIGDNIQPPLSSATTGPVFRSLPPSLDPVRYFPNLKDLSENRTPKWEAIPAVGRNLNFRFTVRDNDPAGGCTAEDNIRLRVDGAAGPFRVVEQNFDKWTAGTMQTIEWEVAGTNNGNISAEAVDILLSVDGGLTYPILVAKNILNIGSASILVPNNITTSARIMIKGHQHIFFDINNQDFEIEPLRNDVVVQVDNPVQRVCVGQEANYAIDLGVSGIVTGSAALTVNNLPVGVVSTFTNTTIRPPGTATLQLSNFSRVQPGTYEFQLLIETQQGTQTRDLQLILLDATSNFVTPVSPADNTVGLGSLPTFEWETISGNENYIYQLSTQRSFDSILDEIAVTDNEYTLRDSLATNTRYYWRVLPVSECATSNPVVFTFTTAAIACKNYSSEDLPLSISPDGTPSIVSTIVIPDKGTLLDINILEVNIEHTFISDLSIGLVSPIETVVVLAVEPCIVAANLLLSFDDEASNAYQNIPCPPTSGETYRGFQVLSALDGERLEGGWSLVLLDQYEGDGGSFNNWTIEACFLDESALPPLSFSVSKEEEICFESNSGKAAVHPIDGTGTYSYQWSNGATSSSIENLSPGIYTVTVSDGDTSLFSSVEILPVEPFDISFDVNNLICPGEQNGRIEIMGAIENLTFLWNDNTNKATLTNLSSGSYSVTVTDQKGCELKREFDILDEAPLQISTTTSAVSCFGRNDGFIEVINAGSQNLSYQWSNGKEGALNTNLPAGGYTVTVSSATGCSEILTNTIEEPLPLATAITIQPISCFGQMTEVGIDVTGGSAPYTISCNDPMGDCTSFSSGVHQVIITDANNCEYLKELVIESPEELKIDLTAENPSTLFAMNGSIQTQVEGGVPPYKYSWNTGSTTKDVDNLEAGLYTLSVEDSLGCTQTKSIEIEMGDCYSLAIGFSIDQPNCITGGLGSINAIPMNGSPPFTYKWNTDDTINPLEELAAGFYQVTITDALGCTGFGAPVLESESDLQVTLISNVSYSCQSGVFGSLEVQGTGGVGALNYVWSSKQTGSSIDSLLEGNYTVTVTDELGCATIKSYTVGNTDEFLKPKFMDQVILVLDSTEEVLLENFMLMDTLIDSCSVHAIQLSKLWFDCSDLGTNQVIVTTQFTNATTEMTTLSILVKDTIAPAIQCPGNILIETCREDSPVFYDIFASDNCGDYQMELIQGIQSGELFPPGETRVTYRAKDAAGNESICEFTVSTGTGDDIQINYDVTAVIADENPEDNLLILLHSLEACDSINFSSFVKPSGGIPPYDINISSYGDEIETSIIVEVWDSNQCKMIDTLTGMVNFQPPKVTAEEIATTGSENDGAISVVIEDFLFPIIRYAWFTDSVFVSNEKDITDLSSGEYVLEITDSKGCSYTYDFRVGMLVSTSTFTQELKEQVFLRPNPTRDEVNISLNATNNAIQDVELFTVTGQQLPVAVPSQHKDRKRVIISIGNYPSGIYLVKVYTKLGVVLKKVMVH